MRALIAIFAILFFMRASLADIVIGVSGPMTGANASFGAAMLGGVNAAVDDINQNGGIDGELLSVVSVDDGCDVKKAEDAARSLIGKSVRVVVGPFCTFPAIAAAKLYEAAHIPLIAPSATYPALTESALSNVVRLTARDDSQGGFAAGYMAQSYASNNVALLNDGTDVNAALVKDFLANLSAAPAVALTFKPDTKDIDGLVADLVSHNISAVYCACSAADAGLIASRTNNIQFFGPDALLVPQFWQIAGEAGNGTLVSFPRDPEDSSEARHLRVRFSATEPFDILSYAAVQIFGQAYAKNSSNVIGTLKAGNTFETVAGKFTFDAKGDVRPQQFVWYQWQNGKFAILQSQ